MLSRQRWSPTTILAEILNIHAAGQELSYGAMQVGNLALLRAAARQFGSWQNAVEAAGLNYDEIRKYKAWTKERIVDRIRDLHSQGADLSWRHMSTSFDPALAAAATKDVHFGSWKSALEAAGLDYDAIRKYIDWDEERVLDGVRDRFAEGKLLNGGGLEQEPDADVALLTAARRRYGSWQGAVEQAGVNYREVAIRVVPVPKRPREKKKQSEDPPSV